MAVRWRVGTDHLKTCSIVYYSPDGARIVERVGVLRPDATSRERDALEGRAALLSATRRSEVASGTWTPPAAKKTVPERRPFAKCKRYKAFAESPLSP